MILACRSDNALIDAVPVRTAEAVMHRKDYGLWDFPSTVERRPEMLKTGRWWACLPNGQTVGNRYTQLVDTQISKR